MILVPGPDNEVAVVKEIYDRFTKDRESEREIAVWLNERGILSDLGRPWTRGAVHQLLTNPKYSGANVYNRRSFKLKLKRIKNPPEIWVRRDDAFAPIVTREQFAEALATHGAGKKVKKTELAELARKATESFIDAQKKLVDVAGKQMNANVKTAGKTLELLRPFPFLPLAELTREGVKSYVDAQKALMDMMVKPVGAHKPERRKKPVHVKKAAAAAAVA